MKCYLKPEHCKRLHNIRHDIPKFTDPDGDRDIWGSLRSSEFWDEYYSMDEKELYDHGLITGMPIKKLIKEGFELVKCKTCKGTNMKYLDKTCFTSCPDCEDGKQIIKTTQYLQIKVNES